jgi:hypothetical protein
MCLVVASFFAVATVEGQDRGVPPPPGVIVVPWRAETFPVGYTGFVTAYGPGFAYGIIPGGTYCSYAYGCYTEGGTYTSITPTTIDVNGLAMFRYAGTTYLAVYLDGQLQMFVDTAYPPSVQQFVTWMANDLEGLRPGFKDRIVSGATDLWWALKTGASDQCNKATALAGAAALLVFWNAVSANFVTAGANLVGYFAALDNQYNACPR